MTKEEAILKIKDQLKKLMAFSEMGDVEPNAEENKKEMEYETMKLKDGSEISIADGTELGVGVNVFKVDAEGNLTPCDDGEYELEDGRKISLKDGIVESVAEIAVENGEKQDETPMAPAEMAEIEIETKPEEEGGNGMEERINALEKHLAQILELLQGMGQMQEVAMSKIEKLAAEPAAESIKVGKVPAKPQGFSSTRNEIEELNSIRNKFRINNNGGYSFNAAIEKK
jgi:hypothetical protein